MSHMMCSKNCLKRPLKTKLVFQDRLSLNAGQKYCKNALLQYFRPSLSNHPLFCLFLSGSLRQVLLYQNLICWLVYSLSVLER